MTHSKKLQIVGRALKSGDPDTAAMLRREDGVTSLRGLGAYVYDTDIDQFNRTIEHYLQDLENEANEVN